MASTPIHRTDGSEPPIARLQFWSSRGGGNSMEALTSPTLSMEPTTNSLADWLDLHDAALPVDFASHLDAANLARLLEKLDGRQQRLALLLQAMVQLLEAQGLLSQETLLTMAEAIDRSDGVADGRLARQSSQRCGACGRVNLGNRQRCLYCGSEDLQALPPRTL